MRGARVIQFREGDLVDVRGVVSWSRDKRLRIVTSLCEPVDEFSWPLLTDEELRVAASQDRQRVSAARRKDA